MTLESDSGNTVKGSGSFTITRVNTKEDNRSGNVSSHLTYISGRGGDLRPSDEVSGRDDERDDDYDERDERRFPTTMRRQADSESTTGQADRLRDVSDGAAIAGDPMSSPRLRDRPRRTVKLPTRFIDFLMP